MASETRRSAWPASALTAALVISGLWLMAGPHPALGEDGRLKVVMLGDSLTQGGRWSDYFPECKVANLGIGGDTTIMMLRRLDRVIAAEPRAVFIQGGINDFASKIRPEAMLKNHEVMWDRLRSRLPLAELQVISLLPVAEDKFPGWNRRIREINQALKARAEAEGLVFIDLYALLADETGQLKPEVTFDGLHLTAAGYEIWSAALRPQLRALAGNGRSTPGAD